MATFGMILHDSKYKGTASLETVLEIADEGKGQDKSGYRAEFIELVKKARLLMRNNCLKLPLFLSSMNFGDKTTATVSSSSTVFWASAQETDDWLLGDSWG
mgnify:CR=1 FL=1